MPSHVPHGLWRGGPGARGPDRTGAEDAGYDRSRERRRHVCSRLPDGADVVRARAERGRPVVGRRLESSSGLRSDRGRGQRLLAGAGLPYDEMRFVRQADLRHAGQGHEIVLELPFAELERADVEREVAPLFYDAYEKVYGHAHRHLSLEIVTCRVTAVGPKPTISIRQKNRPARRGAARTGSRRHISPSSVASSTPRRSTGPAPQRCGVQRPGDRRRAGFDGGDRPRGACHRRPLAQPRRDVQVRPAHRAFSTEG